MTAKYYISRKNRSEYLQGIEVNDTYIQTMGVCHGFSVFMTVWGDKPVAFERLTAANYIKVIMEEFRWGDVAPYCVILEPEAAEA